jgi:hypothetical protein
MRLIQSPKRYASGRPASVAGLLAAGLLAFLSMACGDGNPPRAPEPAPVAGAADQSRKSQDQNSPFNQNDPSSPMVINSILHPWMEELLHAAYQWRQSWGPQRRVVDQVYLVPDLVSFFAVITTWDEHTFFPVLLDDPAWSLPFVRVFNPSRVVRIGPGASNDTASRP